MKPLLHSSLSVVFSLGALLAGLTMPSPLQAAASAKTLANLNTAYQGESNPANRYARFAEKAVGDGFAQVGRLFRAAAMAEGIHRDTHKKAILDLGGTVATFQLDSVSPAATAENLRAAIKGESYERDIMYPEFLALAKSEDCRPAIRTLNFALQTEKSHATLYEEALDQLGKAPALEYYVCQECGETLTSLPAKKCPVCRTGRDEFTRVE